MSDTRPFFTALHDRTPEQLRDDGEALVEVAEAGICHAARDVSMPGIAGSLLQMIEGAGCGAVLDLDRLPRPHGAPLERWLLTFPSFGFLLAAKPEHAEAAALGVHPARAGLRAVRRVRPHAGAAAGRRRRRGARVGPRAHPAHGAGPSGIAIGWWVTPW